MPAPAVEEPTMPKADAVAALAARIVQALEEQKAKGAGAYPPPRPRPDPLLPALEAHADGPLTVRRLAALADPQADADAVRKALADKAVKAALLVALPGDLDAPAAPAAAFGRLAASPAV